MDNLGILIQAILSLKDTTESKNQIAKELPKLESQLQSDKNTRVKIVAGLDVGKSKSLIQSQLNTLTNQAKAPTIKVGIDTSGVQNTQNIANGLRDIQTQAQQTASAINNNTAILESFKQSLRNIGMDSTDIESVANRINGLNVQIESLNQSMSTANGKRGQKNILSVEISGIDKMGQAVKLTQQFNADTGNLIKTIDAVSSATQKENSQLENLMAQQIKRRADLNNQVEQIYQSAIDPNASRSITNGAHLDNLESQYNNIKTAIEGIGSTSKTTFAEQEANISNLISQLKISVSEYQRAENVSTTLKPDKLASGISKAESKFQSLQIDIQNAGVSSAKLAQNVEFIESILNKPQNGGVINKAEIEQVFTALSNAKNEFDALVKMDISESSVEKVRIQAESLIKDLDTFSNSNKGFDNFSATINNATVSVESLKQSLATVSSKSELSIIKAQADALKSSFKATTTDTTKYVEQITKTISKINAIQQSTTFTKNSSNSRVTQIKEEMSQFLVMYKEIMSQLQKSDITPNCLKNLISTLTDLDAKFDLAHGSAKQFETELKNDNGAEKFAQRVSILSTQIKEYQKINSKSLKKFGSEFDSMLSELNNPNIDHQSYEKIRSQFQLIKREINATGLAGKTFFERMKEQAAKFSSWMSLTGVITGLWHDLQKMVTNVIEIDKAMTNLKKVTDETETVYSRFLKNTSQQAKELHATMTDLVEQTATWAKLGYSLNEAENLAKISMIYAKVGEVDNTTAVSDLVTVMKAFNIESSKSITIVDMLNELGGISPLYTVMYNRQSSYIG